MSENWRTIKIEDIAEKVGMGPFGSSIKVETFVKEGIPVISGQHLHKSRLEDLNYNFVTEDHANKLKNANVYRGDVIFTHAGSIGQVSLIPNTSKYERYILSQRQFYLRCDKEKILPEYIVYYFKSKLGQNKLLANVSSSGVPSIAKPVTYLRSIEIEIPDLREQRRIAEILSALDEKIELNLEMNRTLERIAQATFKHWFVDFQFLGFDGELVDGLPKGWGNGKLGDVLDLAYGKGLRADDRVNGEFPVIGSSGVVGFHNDFYVEGAGIVIGRKGTIGDVIWIDENFFPIDTTFFVKDLLEVEDLFFHYYLLQIQDFKKIASDSAVPGLNKNAALQNEVIIPEKNVILQFNEIVKPIFEKKYFLKNENQTLTQIRNNLLPKLMSGKIRVV